jgi:hypothetical protein
MTRKIGKIENTLDLSNEICYNTRIIQNKERKKKCSQLLQ